MDWLSRSDGKDRLRAAVVLAFLAFGGVCSFDPDCPSPILQKHCECVTATWIQCKGSNNTDLPAIVSELPSDTTHFTYTAWEEQVQLGNANFEHLAGLTVLNINTVEDQNVMLRSIEPIPTSAQNILAPLTKLKTLRINVNWGFEYPLDGLFLPLVRLQILDLSRTRKLNVSNLHRAINGLRNNTELHTINLSNIQTYGGATYSTFNLTWFLEPLQNSNLTYLSLSYNALKAIYPGIIRFAPNLSYIDVSHNILAPLLTSAFFTETILHKGLHDADFSYQGFRYDDGTNAFAEDFYQRARRSVRQFALPPTLPAEFLQSHSVRDCVLAVYNDTCKVLQPVCQEIKAFLLAHHDIFCKILYHRFDYPPAENFYRGIPCSAIPRVDEMFRDDDENCGDCTVIPTVGTTKWLNIKNLNVYDEVFVMNTYRNRAKCFNPANKLEELDLSENYEHGYQSIDIFLGTNVTGLTQVTSFNLSNTGLTKFYSNIQTNFPRLRVLDMSRNQIQLDETLSPFANSAIQNLSFANNLIANVSYELFGAMHQLRHLDMSYNKMKDLDFNISGLHALEYFNLAHNRLSHLSKAACEQLTQLANHAANRTITVDLSRNELSCTCDNIHYLQFIQHGKPDNLVFANYDKYLCLDRNSNRATLKYMSLPALKFECLSRLVFVGIGSGIAFVFCLVIVLIIATIHRKRWWFRYQYFLARRLWQNYHRIAVIDAPYRYDLFVSYNQQDQPWIDDVLQPKLEEELGLRLCLHHRDFRLGEVITEQILESVETSKKTLFILSASFLASTWCHFEVHMAHNRLFSSGKDVIMLAILEPLPNRLVSKTLKSLMETHTYVEWTETDTYGQKLFWAKLHESVKAPITEPFDLASRSMERSVGGQRSRETQHPRSRQDDAAAMETEPLLPELTHSWHSVQVTPQTSCNNRP